MFPFFSYSFKIETTDTFIPDSRSFLENHIRFQTKMGKVYLCDFAKRCPLSFRLNTVIARVQASKGGKKTRGLGILLGVSREPRARPIRGWVASLFCVKTRGVGRGDFVTFD